MSITVTVASAAPSGAIDRLGAALLGSDEVESFVVDEPGAVHVRWQPIETAPPIPILGYRPGAVPHCVVVEWRDGGGRSRGGYFSDAGVRELVTHWAPLPAAPA